MADSFARELDLNDFWDRWMFYILGVGLGYIEPDFWRDSNPITLIVILVWHFREIWRIFRGNRWQSPSGVEEKR